MGVIERRCLVEFDPAGERICERREGHDGDHRGPLRGSERAKVYVELRNTRGAVEALHRAHALLDVEHGHSAETWADREHYGEPTGGQ